MDWPRLYSKYGLKTCTHSNKLLYDSKQPSSRVECALYIIHWYAMRNWPLAAAKDTSVPPTDVYVCAQWNAVGKKSYNNKVHVHDVIIIIIILL